MIDLTPLLSIGVLLVRPGALVVSAPTFGGLYAPAQVKIGLTLVIALALLPTATVPQAGSALGLAAVLARETAIGLALAMAIRALVAAAELAGHLAGFQMGLAYSALVDPASGVRNNLLSSLYGSIAIIVLLLTNAHHAFLRALGASYQTLPVGFGHVGDTLPQAVVALLGLVFTFGVRLAAPFVVVLVIAEIAMAAIARSAPSLNLLAVGAPVRVIIGLVLLGLVAPAAVGVLADAAGGILQLGLRTADAFR